MSLSVGLISGFSIKFVSLCQPFCVMIYVNQSVPVILLWIVGFQPENEISMLTALIET